MRILFSFLLFSGIVLSVNAQEQSVLENYLRNYQYQEALKWIETQEPDKKLRFQEALCYKALNNYNKAIEILVSLSFDDPADPAVKAELAQCYEATSSWKAGIDCYNELIDMDSTNLYFKIKKADLLLYQTDSQSALHLYNEISTQHPMPLLFRKMGICLENMNLPDSAAIYYNEAWKNDSTDAFSATNLVKLKIKTGRIREALEASELFMARDSSNKQINALNALCYYNNNEYEEAINRFEKCYRKGDTSLIVNRSLGISYYSVGDNENTIRYLQKAYLQDSTNNNVLYCLGVSYNELSRTSEAVECFNILLSRTIPADITIYLYLRGLAIAYEKSKNFDMSIDYYQQALEYASPNQQMDLLFSISQIYDFDLENKSQALVYYRKYHTALTNYLEQLKTKENPDKEEIDYISSKIQNLENYIERLIKFLEATEKK